MDNPLGAAGDRKGVRTDRRHVFIERSSPVGERRTDIRGDGDDLLRKFRNQMVEKRRRVFGRSSGDLRIKVFGELLHGEEDPINHAEAAIGEGNFVGGDFKAIGPRQTCAGEGRTLGGRPDFAEPIALQALIERRPAQLGQ